MILFLMDSLLLLKCKTKKREGGREGGRETTNLVSGSPFYPSFALRGALIVVFSSCVTFLLKI
jgi:hypothetical protein